MQTRKITVESLRRIVRKEVMNALKEAPVVMKRRSFEAEKEIEEILSDEKLAKSLFGLEIDPEDSLEDRAGFLAYFLGWNEGRANISYQKYVAPLFSFAEKNGFKERIEEEFASGIPSGEEALRNREKNPIWEKKYSKKKSK